MQVPRPLCVSWNTSLRAQSQTDTSSNKTLTSAVLTSAYRSAAWGYLVEVAVRTKINSNDLCPAHDQSKSQTKRKSASPAVIDAGRSNVHDPNCLFGTLLKRISHVPMGSTCRNRNGSRSCPWWSGNNCCSSRSIACNTSALNSSTHAFAQQSC